MNAHMTPVCLCLRKVEHAAATDGPALTERIFAALSDVEAAYARPSERVVALESVLQDFTRGPQAGNAALGRLLRIAIDRRQGVWARRAATRRGVTAGERPRAAEPATSI